MYPQSSAMTPNWAAPGQGAFDLGLYLCLPVYMGGMLHSYSKLFLGSEAALESQPFR